MSENLVLRVKRLVSSNANSLVDTLESAAPEKTMREAIREVDRAIDDVRAEQVKAIALRHQTNRRLELLKSKCEELSGKAQIAVGQKRDDLAEVAISRQLDFEAQVPVLEQAARDAAARQTELESHLAALRGRKGEMEADLNAFVSARDPIKRDGFTGPMEVTNANVQRRADRAQNTFDRVMKTTASLPGQTESDRDAFAKLSELDKVVRNEAVARRLASVKSLNSAK